MTLFYKNSLSGVSQLVLTAALTFLSVPVFIRSLGEEAYGAFSIVTLVGNLNIFANLGLNTALLKFLTVQGKSRDSDHDIVVTLGLLLAIVLPLSLLALRFRTTILTGVMGLSGLLYDRVAVLYVCVIGANAILLLGQTFTTVLDAQQRNYLTNFYQFVYSLLYWGGIMVVVALGYDMAEVGFVVLGTAVIWFGLIVVAAWRSWGTPDLTGIGTGVGLRVRKQLAVSSKVYSAGLLMLLFEPMTKLLVARLIGVREVGYLEIAYKVRSQLWSLINKVTYPLFPKIALETNLSRLNQLISGYQSALLLLIIPFLLFFSIALPDLLWVWLGMRNDELSTATLVISVSYLIGAIAVPPSYFLVSSRHAGKMVWLQLTNVVINGLVILTTYRTLGFYGAILGNALAIAGSLVLSIVFQNRYMGGFRLQTQLYQILLPIGAVSALAGLAGYVLTDPIVRIGTLGLLTIGLYGLLLRSSLGHLKSWIA